MPSAPRTLVILGTGGTIAGAGASTTAANTYRSAVIGVDALIVQDLGVMELDIPPIELHASTQTDIGPKCSEV